MLAVAGLNAVKKIVHTVKSRLSKTIFGALNMHTNRFYWKQADRGNSEQFIWFLRQLPKASPNKKLIIILDNGSILISRKNCT